MLSVPVLMPSLTIKMIFFALSRLLFLSGADAALPSSRAVPIQASELLRKKSLLLICIKSSRVLSVYRICGLKESSVKKSFERRKILHRNRAATERNNRKSGRLQVPDLSSFPLLTYDLRQFSAPRPPARKVSRRTGSITRNACALL